MLVIPWHAEVIFIHAGELILRRSKALVRGFAVPTQGVQVIECHVAGPKIVIPEGELRLGVPRSGGIANIRDGRLRKQQRGNHAEREAAGEQKTALARGRGSLPEYS